MPLQIIRNDITKVKADAIVNAANESLLGGGGVDGAIHRAAGPELLKECRTLHGCKTGDAKITGAYRLPAKYVIHTVGPIWRGGEHHEKELLASCYRRSLEIAREYHCESVAFPLISSGIYGYPKAEALQVAVNTISAFLLENDLTVYIVVFDRSAVQIGEKLFADIQEYVDDHYVDTHRDSRLRMFQRRSLLSHHTEEFDDAEAEMLPEYTEEFKDAEAGIQPHHTEEFEDFEACMEPHHVESPQHNRPEMATYDGTFAETMAAAPAPAQSLEEALDQIDESFSEMLLRKIDEAGMKDSECYKRANIDRKLFSKIRGDMHYKPRKQTAIAFAIALHLSLNETNDMLMKAGYALSHSNKFDIIIEYFIRQENYNIFEINEALFAFDQPLLGG